MKHVYIQATNYLVTLEELSATTEKKILAPQTIDHYVVATKPEYNKAVKDIASREFIKAVKTSSIVKGKLLSIKN